MKRLVLPLVLALSIAAPVARAQDAAPNTDLSEGAEMLAEGMKRLFEGLMTEGAEGWDQLLEWLGDFSAYEAPERLPGGDIIIRRSPDAPPFEPSPEAQTEL